MKTREEIITSMCYTWRHDYGLLKEADPGDYMSSITAGMTREEQQSLWRQMAQIFDNDIAPLLKDAQDLYDGNSVVIPKDKTHAEALVKMGMFYLEQKNDRV